MKVSRNTTPEFGSISRAVDYAVDRLVDDGMAMTTVAYTSHVTLEGLRKEVGARVRGRVTKNLLRNHGDGEEDGWVNVQRMTFFGPSHAETAKQKIASRVLPATILVPRIYRFGDNLQYRIGGAGLEFGIKSLADWTPNRYGINVLDGSTDYPALVAPHTDVVTEHGVVVALEIPERGFTTEDILLSGGNLSFIFGRDTCNELGVSQLEHSIESESRRFSITLADLRPSMVLE